MLAAGSKAGALEEFSEKLAERIPGLEVKSVSDSPVPGLVEVITQGDETLYITQDAKHFLVGDLFRFELGKMLNLSEEKRKAGRAEQLSRLPQKDFLVFAPKETKATINVFTDIDCFIAGNYIRKLDKLNAYGIRVNYLAYPREGIGSESYQKAVSAWCAENHNSH